MFKDQLIIIQKELHLHHNAKDKVLEDAIKYRLTQCLETYEQELAATLGYLTRRDELNVLSKLNRRNKDA